MKSKTIDIWEQTVKNPPKQYQEYFVAEKVFLRLYLSNNFSVLDIGSGTGRTMKEIAPLVKDVVGIDNDPTAIEASKVALVKIKNTSVFLEDAEKMHFSDHSFDAVFIGLSFVNFGETKHTILSEIKRVLKEDGKLIFSVFNEHALQFREQAYREYKGGYTILDNKGTIRFNEDGGISEQFNKEEITAILLKSGFRIVKLEKGAMYYLIACEKLNNDD